ncbi:MAG: HTH domain-containing protein [Clostridiales bacterium]|jgi:transcriptional pleiotropic repressor|nr:HTH domain-containing protein [Clostridiales bacterium]
MEKDLLSMAKRLKDIIQNTDFEDLAILKELCEEMGRQSESSVLLVNKTGRVLADFLLDGSAPLFTVKDVKGMPSIDTQLNEQFKAVYESRVNANLNSYYIKNVTKAEIKKINAAVFPTIASGERNGTLVLYKTAGEFSSLNETMGEFCSSALSLIIEYTQNEETTEEYRKNELVKSALGTLSYSELEAVVHIFKELNGREGLLVASKIADKVGITRSVIVNALRKLESAGVIESRSLGMKGTYIKVTNDHLIEEMRNYRN